MLEKLFILFLGIFFFFVFKGGRENEKYCKGIVYDNFIVCDFFMNVIKVGFIRYLIS